MSTRRGGVLLRPITGFYFVQSESNLYWMQWAEQSPAPTEWRPLCNADQALNQPFQNLTL